MIQLTSDGLKVNGPKVDGGYSVTFTTGGHEAINIAKLLALANQGLIVQVSLAEIKTSGVIGG